MLDSNLQEYWKSGGQNEAAVSDVIAEALDDPPDSAKACARVLQIAARHSLGAGYRDRVDAELRPRAEVLRHRVAQIDQIANRETDPQAIVEVLGEEAEGLNWSDFEPERLREKRASAVGKVNRAEAFLEELGWDNLPEQTRTELQRSLGDLRSQAAFDAQALLVDPQGNGFVLGLNCALKDDGEVRSDEQTDSAMETQAGQAIHVSFGDSQGARYSLEWQFPLEGKSIGLAILAAAHVARKDVESDPLSAVTGEVGVDGSIVAVEGIEAKLEAAASAGMRRVLLPAANRTEAEGCDAAAELELIYVSEVSELRRLLARVPSGTPVSLEGKRRMVRGAAKEFGFEVSDEKKLEHGYQFKLSALDGTATISLYASGKAAIGGSGSPKSRAEEMAEKWFPSVQPEPRSPITLTVSSAERRERIEKALLGIDAEEIEVNDHESWRLRLRRGTSSVTVVQYASGKLVLQGNAPAWDEARQILADELGDLKGGDALTETPAIERVRARRQESGEEPWIGTDESGKGDFFGPLVSAAVYTTPKQGAELKEMGVADSKKLSDKRVHELAPQLRQTLGNAAYVTAINPPRVNTLYREMRSRGQTLNSMLAWGHARSIENLLKRGLEPGYAIVDQFADVRFLNRELLAETRRSELEILQFPKAEMDIAVAAASILAREVFLNWLAKASAELDLELPKGAGPQVIEAAQVLAGKIGEENLTNYVKLFFKTAQKVLAA
jgi:ribonuclease HIII